MRQSLEALDWAPVLRQALSTPAMLAAAKEISRQRKVSTGFRGDSSKKIWPKQEDVFKAFELCSLKDLKVLILGQDPYHKDNLADGLAFSSGVAGFCPASLRVILNEVESDVYGTLQLAKDYSLEHWAKQGVLLLNTALTVVGGQPGSHVEYWKSFTQFVLQYIGAHCNGIVVMLWGKHAESYKDLFHPDRQLILVAGHPSPLNRTNPFRGCKHLTKANDYLISLYGEDAKIKW